MSRRTSIRRVRATAVLRAGWGGALLLVPRRLLNAAGYRPAPAGAVLVLRVLGARHLAQAAAGGVAARESFAALGAVVDTLHSGTCVGLAAGSGRWRRAALLDAAVEAGFAAAGWRCRPRSVRTRR
jgi:hypothetical protein